MYQEVPKMYYPVWCSHDPWNLMLTLGFERSCFELQIILLLLVATLEPFNRCPSTQFKPVSYCPAAKRHNCCKLHQGGDILTLRGDFLYASYLLYSSPQNAICSASLYIEKLGSTHVWWLCRCISGKLCTSQMIMISLLKISGARLQMPNWKEICWPQAIFCQLMKIHHKHSKSTCCDVIDGEKHY